MRMFQARVLEMAIKPAEGAAMQAIREAVAEPGAGFVGAARASPDRGLTLLSARQWRHVIDELAADLSWRLRRANLLLDADSLQGLIGRIVQIGDVRVRIVDETRPCGLMDAQHKGLTRALARDCRGGVHGRVLTGGAIRVGDVLRVVDEGG